MNSQNVSTFSLKTPTSDVLTEADVIRIRDFGVTTIDAALYEISKDYPDVEPYDRIELLDGPCFKWTPLFINKCQVAMSTDRMTQFTVDELAVWRFFVNFENYNTHSAKDSDANGTAIGCTNPNDKNQSFVVAGDGVILDGTNSAGVQYCQPPGYEVESEEIWKSLDKAFMSIYNCEDSNDCLINDSMIEHPCSVTT